MRKVLTFFLVFFITLFLGGNDTFRIKIWYENANSDEVGVYDNGFDQIIGGGNINVHSN